MIRIGIEVSSRNLRCDLLENPGRYFFILATGGQATLCIKTCDFHGEDIKMHIIDALAPDGEGNLDSIFEDGINGAILEWQDWKKPSMKGGEYPISSHLVRVLSGMPDLMDWIISSILNNERNLIVCPFESNI